ncbi:Coenzyme F420 hydrogenase/dehydrogenase, beta subunit C-terminal domain [Agromyces bauzanensis]|uniref:Coenzyme F420 hydrogenase n=3 Tax=Agromyces bauzanensis TaxID=1308924 RepID=A0A917UWG6_9MICO|nr:coenzyme F420 hydrogenase [Agromyces bauzanensis]
MHVGHGIEAVLQRGMCVGCGGCALAAGPVRVALNSRGVYQADLSELTPAQRANASRVCPFSDDAADEDVLAGEQFASLPRHPALGRHLGAYAGRSARPGRLESSSGGLTSLLLEELLRRGLVDGVIHVGRSDGDALFAYRVSRSAQDVRAVKGSVYSATSFAEVLAAVRGDGRRYAFVGVPCFVTAVRLLAREDPALAGQVPYLVGLVCGHLKSGFFAESLSWQAGVKPAALTSIDFRVKNPHRRAYSYDYRVTGGGKSRDRRIDSTLDGNWAYGAFQPEACNFCDDVFAETADITFGDAWVAPYLDDWRGTNIVVTRSRELDDLVRELRDVGQIELDELTPERVALSQAGGLRHRRDGLRVRLADDRAAGLSVPRKRVEPGYEALTEQRIALVRQRRVLSRISLEAFAEARRQGRWAAYARPMRRGIRRYRAIEAASTPWVVRQVSRWKARARKLIGR